MKKGVMERRKESQTLSWGERNVFKMFERFTMYF
jgi:hypothetical protein